MGRIIVEVALFLLAIGFISWWLYVTMLGLKSFFGIKKNDSTAEKEENHKNEH